MFGLKKKKGTIEKISEECRKYFNNDKEIEEENSDEEIEVENFYEKIEVESFDKEIETENDDKEIQNSDENKVEIKENEEIENEHYEKEKRVMYGDIDEYFVEAARYVIESERAAAGQLQRRFSIGFNRAGRIIDQLHKAGIVGPAEGTKPRKILITLNEFERRLNNVDTQLEKEEKNIESDLSENVQYEDKEDILQENTKINAIELIGYLDTLDGYNFEKICACILKCNDFYNVDITSGSKDRGVDIIAEKNGMKYAIQCKRYSSNVGNHAIQEVFSGKSIYNADVAVVLTNSYFTQQAEQDARTLCVELWNRSKLLNMIENIGYTSEVTEQSYGEEISNDCLKLFCENILEAFRQFQVYLMIQNVYVGDVYIKYGFALEKGIRIKKVLSLQNDISLNLGVAIQIDVNYEKSNIEIIIPRKFLYERYMQ